MNISHISDLKALQQSQQNEILRLAKRNSVQLMNRPIKTVHPMFGVTSAWMLSDIRLQLDPTKSKTLNSELIIIENDESKIVGFMTFTRATNSPSACGINYICVDSKYRNQGLMRSMIDLIKSKFTDIALACFPELVEMYERIGFVMYEADGAQVAMRIGNVYEMNKILPEILLKEQEVCFATDLMISKNGQKKALKINKIFDDETREISRRVEVFVQKRKHIANP